MNALLTPTESTANKCNKTLCVGNNRRTAASRAIERTGRFLRLMVGRRGLRVMVVDSDQESADDLAWRLHCWGHDSIATYDGASAIRCAAIQRPQIILLNLKMPGLNGSKVARRLRTDFPAEVCFIIGVTQRTDAQQREASIPTGIDLLLIKPVQMMVLETLLMLECDRVHRMQTPKNARTNGKAKQETPR